MALERESNTGMIRSEHVISNISLIDAGQRAYREFRFVLLLLFGDKQDQAQSHAADVGQPFEIQNYRDVLPLDFLCNILS